MAPSYSHRLKNLSGVFLLLVSQRAGCPSLMELNHFYYARLFGLRYPNFVAIIIFYGVIAIHDIPYEIAQHRGHPHQDAIHVAGWVSLFTLHVLWPFLWIWATLYRKDRGWGFVNAEGKTESEGEAVLELQKQMRELRQEVAELQIANMSAHAKSTTKGQDKSSKGTD